MRQKSALKSINQPYSALSNQTKNNALISEPSLKFTAQHQPKSLGSSVKAEPKEDQLVVSSGNIYHESINP